MKTTMNVAKKYLSKWLVYLIQQLHAADNYITRHLDIENSNGYDDLTPIDKADEDKNYSEALIWALKTQRKEYRHYWPIWLGQKQCSPNF